MEYSTLLTVLAYVILSLGVIAILMITVVGTKTKYNVSERIRTRSFAKTTKKLDEGEDEKKCDICLGIISEDPVAACKCGKLFHDACARPTGSCPYCGTPYEELEVRDPIRTRCPVCGRFIKGGVCVCGSMIPRLDNTFMCSCGNRVDASKPTCKRCGAAYEKVSMKLNRED